MNSQRLASLFPIKLAMALIFILVLNACANLPKQAHSIDNNELFREFNILVSSEQEILQAAYQTLISLYPSSLIIPITGGGSPGYSVDVESLDLDLYPFRQTLGFETFWEPAYGYQVRFQFDQTMGRTPLGSIVTGFRYSITTIPRGNVLFFIDDGSYDIDVVFRSELMKHHIPNLIVTKVV